MLKRSVIGLALSALLGTFVFGREAVSYMRTGVQNVRNAVKAEVPIEFEIERARNLVDQLVPDIRQCMHVVAEQQVDIEQIRASLNQRDSDVSKQREAIQARRMDLSSNKPTLTYCGRTYAIADVRRDVATRFDRLKAAEEIMNADRRILVAREQTLAANREKLDSMIQAKKELEVKLEQLQARIHTVQAAEAVSRLSIDDSNLSHARKLIVDLNKQLDVKQRMLDTEGKFVGLIPIEEPQTAVPEDLEQQIDNYLGRTSQVQPDQLHSQR